MMEELKTRLRNIVNKVVGKGVINKEIIREIIKEIQKGLLLSDVNVKLVLDLSKRIEKRLVLSEVPSSLTIREYVIKVIYDELTQILGKDKQEINVEKAKPFKILLVGLQGSGKTTTVAKLANYYCKLGYKVGVFSVDTFRPAGREQLRQLCKKINSTNLYFFDLPENDPIRIAREGINHLTAKNVDIILIDTAGRHKDEDELMKEVHMLEELIKPNLTLLVVDGSIGQQAYTQAEAFNKAVKIGGLIVTKLDGTARGGGALSAAIATGANIFFIGTGEKIEDIEEYDPPSLVSRLLGIGDLKSLIQKFRSIELDKVKKERLMKIAKGKFTLLDMIEQIEETKKVGALSKIIEYIPGLSLKVPKELINEIEDKMRKWKIALDSMTDEEKVNPNIIKGSRLQRISRGSGVEERVIKEMIRHYNILKKITKSGRGKRLIKLLSEKYLKRGFRI